MPKISIIIPTYNESQHLPLLLSDLSISNDEAEILIIDCNSEDEYKRKIPLYLFKEKNYLVDIYRKYNSKKKKMLLKLLSSTESVLRKESGLSLVVGLRFLLNIKKITIS